MMKTLPLTAGAMVLTATAVVYGQAPAAASPPKASAGLVNDWLRAESDAFRSWDLGGQLRARFEFRDHLGIAGQPGSLDFRDTGAETSNAYGLFRAKLHVGYTPADWVSVYVEGRDSSSFNDRRNPNPEEDHADLHQAFITLGNARRFPVTAKVGRQELAYGDERLVGASDWTNLGRVFDAAKVRYESAAFSLDAFTGRVIVPEAGRFNVANDYDLLSGLYAVTRKLVPKQETHLYLLARNTGLGSPTAVDQPLQTPATPRDIYTAGFRMKSLPGVLGPWDYAVEAAGQLGRYKFSATGPSLDHEAWALMASAGYTFQDCPAKPRVALEYNFASGDSNPADGRHETFENLFPTNHKFYGAMDLFSWQNVHNPRLSLAAKPCKTVTINLDYHLFWLADTADFFYGVAGAPRRGATSGSGQGYGLNPAYDNWVGSELDLVVTCTPKPWLIGQAGYGHFFVGDYVQQSLAAPGFGAADADWFYAQLTLKF